MPCEHCDDAVDAALAAAARDDPALPADTARAVLEGRLHPLTAWRSAAGLSMSALGARAGGIRTATISDIEGGKIDPRFSTVAALAQALGLEAGDIMP